MKKTVLVIGPGMEIGGVERSLLGLLDAIDYKNFEVDLFLYAHNGDLMPYINPKVTLLPENQNLAFINKPIKTLLIEHHFEIAFTRIVCKIYGDLKAKLKKTTTNSITLCKKIVSERMDAFPKHYDYALGFFGPYYILNDKVNADIKIGWVHTDYSNPNEKPDLTFITPMWEKLPYIACVSLSVEESFKKVFPSLANRTIAVENIISPEFIRRQADEYEVKEFGESGDFKILSIGRFCNAKAFDLIPEVCNKLIERGLNIKWYLIGYGPDEKLIHEKIREWDMEGTVIILGKKTNPYPYIKACDLYAQLSRYEGKAVTVTEALILHKAVIITRYATSSSQVEEGVDGYICELGVEGIIRGVEYLITHPEAREKLIEGTQKKNYSHKEELDIIWGLKSS